MQRVDSGLISKNIYNETPMELSAFNKNAEYEDSQALIIFITNLIFMTPGMIPEMPDMGFDIERRRHMIMNDKNLAEQSADLVNQINTYANSPILSDVKLGIDPDDKLGETILIYIELRTGVVAMISTKKDGKREILLSNKDFER